MIGCYTVLSPLPLRLQRIEPHTFLPLDGIRVYSISEKLRSLGGTCKLLFDCVKYSTPEVKVHSF